MARFGSFAIAILVLCITSSSVQGQVKTLLEQRKEMDRIKDTVVEASKKYKSGEFEEAGKLISAAIADANKILTDADPRAKKFFEPTLKNIEKAHQLLSIEGVELPELPGKETKNSEKGSSKEGSVSFVKDIAPWMVTQCGQCHIQAKRGRFSMESFSELMKGSAGGVVLFAKDVKGSRLVEVIESGDMPRGGGKVSPENLEKLKQWINEGAKFDGADDKAKLSSLVTANPNNAPMKDEKPQLVRSTGKEKVSFARDIAPILIEQCSGCHVEARRAQGGLNMSSFAQMLRGGDSGSLWNTKEVDASLIVKKLRGQAGNRMPAGGKPPLSEQQIALFTSWISEKATFDGGSDNAKLSEVVEVAWAKNASDREMSDKRRELARKQWNLVLPKTAASEASDSEFFVQTDLGPSEAEKILKAVQEANKVVKKQLRIGTSDPLVKGGLNIYAFGKRYDYGEFGKMAESRTLPPEWNGHWRKQAVNAYIVLNFDSKEEAKNHALLVQLLSAVHVGAQKEVPQWFGDGVGRAIVANVAAGEDPRIKEWINALPTVSAKLKDPNDLLQSRIGEEEAALTGFALVRFISTGNQRKQFDQLLRQLHNGISFDEAFGGTFGPADLFIRKWLGLPAKR